MPRKTKAQKAKELAHRLKYLDYDPLEELVKLAKGSRKPELKKQIAADLIPYVYPKLKPVELDQSSQQPVVFNFSFTGEEVENGSASTAVPFDVAKTEDSE